MEQNTNKTLNSEKNTTYNVAITALSHDGRGIAHINNKITFVEGALPDEVVKIILTSQKKNFNQGEVVEILTPSPDRVASSCKHYDVCGGCSLQHLIHKQQILFKTEVIKEHLKHIGGFDQLDLSPPIVGATFGYRSKARLSVKYVQKKQKVLVGFHEKKGRYVADIEECSILHPTVGKLITPLSQLIANLSIYNFIPQIEVACGDSVTALVFRNLQEFSSQDIEQISQFAEQHKVEIYSQAGGVETVKPIETNKKSSSLIYQLPDHNIEITFAPTDFTQINRHINIKLVNLAIELLDIRPEEKVLDLFCGIGNFTLPIAKKGKLAVGVEGSKSAVLRAKQNATNNHLENTEFYAVDLAKELPQAPWAIQHYDKILLDPPRTGAREICVEIKKFKAKKIVYVSCNPATLARDAKEIAAHGYKLESVTLVDMYPHTSHMELVASFVLPKKETI